ncbi:uncharacterized protein BDW70DRAFT_166201 [Aspergillus foveolatus]|uniref:uncharacterized protein n=1 Tax=Aspergillus foveolatus TaxID=210207 RepID=UPI003CCDB7C8
MEPSPVSDSPNNYSPPTRSDTVPIRTEYMQMLLDLDYIPWYYNLASSTANWVLLAGYLVIPGTFTSLQKSDTLNDSLSKTKTGQAIIATVQNPPLLVIACTFLVVGAACMAWLFWERRDNYIWLVNRLFIPTCLNSLAGLLTTIINIYTAKSGDWSIMALLTTIMTGLALSISVTLTVVYKFGKLQRLRQEHDMEIKAGFCKVSHERV